MTSEAKCIHDTYAPFWTAGLVVLCATSLATIWTDLGAFWKSNVLDMTGPAWSYFLFRGLFTSHRENAWFRFFNPVRIFGISLHMSASCYLCF